MIRRGDIVIVDIPYTDVAGFKSRPAVVIQNDRDNQRLRKAVVAIITGNLQRTGDPSHFVIDPATTEGSSAGIRGRSLASCNNLFTVEQSRIRQVVGHLSDALMKELNECLRAALEIA